ncbi:mucin-like protein [Strongylocentrotus purpuratus]|uniref:VWFD domain-containing protein n=1 Tax=Strongylocentrotus purpuratus TaxID=7668 RepID=A0A7M7NZV8_STRPU|nr:mucin-like protein [Strongylocentrotus purpuratus]
MTTHDDALTILVTIPNRFKYNTHGMLGTWNDDQSDDLQRPDDDVIIPATSSMETIFHEFGNTWRVKKNESLFYYRPGYNQSSYTNYNYTPSLIEPTFSLDDRIGHVCGTSQLCAFDLLVTAREEFAGQTLRAIEQYQSTRKDLEPGIGHYQTQRR